MIPGFFDIVHAKNKGAAFRNLREGDHQLPNDSSDRSFGRGSAFHFVSAVAAGQSRVPSEQLTTFGLALVLGGALGQHLRSCARTARSRISWSSTPGSWRFAAFNVADSAISVGAGLLILDMWRTRKHQRCSRN